MSDQRPRILLTVFAHPDDETFGMGGTLTKYTQEGITTALVCATRGERGEISDPSLATPANLAQVREGELRAACAEMGVGDLSFLDYIDGDVNKADVDEATGRIVRQIRRLRPQVIVTFGPDGGYGHVDHIAIHHLTVAAHHASGDPARYPEHLAEGLAPHRAERLYVTATPRSILRALFQAIAEHGLGNFQMGGNAATLTNDQMGIPDELITTRIDITPYFNTKMRAVRCHRTQLSATNPFSLIPDDQIISFRGREWFIRIDPPGAPGNQQETDLFAGLS